MTEATKSELPRLTEAMIQAALQAWFAPMQPPEDEDYSRDMRAALEAGIAVAMPFANAQDGMKGGCVSAIAASCEPTEEMVSVARRAAPPELYHMPEFDGTSVRTILRAALRARAEQRETPSAVVGGVSPYIQQEIEMMIAERIRSTDRTRDYRRTKEAAEFLRAIFAAPPTSDGG